MGRDRGLPIALPIAEGGPIAVEGLKQRWYSIQPVEGATKVGLSVVRFACLPSFAACLLVCLLSCLLACSLARLLACSLVPVCVPACPPSVCLFVCQSVVFALFNGCSCVCLFACLRVCVLGFFVCLPVRPFFSVSLSLSFFFSLSLVEDGLSILQVERGSARNVKKITTRISGLWQVNQWTHSSCDMI